MRPLLVLQGLMLAGVAALGIVGLAVPSAVPAVPEPRSAAAIAALVAGLVLYGAVGWRAFRTYRLTRRFGDLLVVVGTAWLVAALAAATLLAYFQLGWWIGHGLEILGIAAIGVPVALDFRRTAQSRPVFGDISACELVAQEEAFLGAQVSALTQLLANRDTQTEEHTLLRTLGFADEVRRLVRDHHERVDGSGYPFGTRGEYLALETKILGVCDVYDALISPRVYRSAWEHGRAIDFLNEHAGTAFEPRVVRALELVLIRERPRLALAS